MGRVQPEPTARSTSGRFPNRPSPEKVRCLSLRGQNIKKGTKQNVVRFISLVG